MNDNHNNNQKIAIRLFPPLFDDIKNCSKFIRIKLSQKQFQLILYYNF